ncbi:MAG: aminotransferase class V-fold PLP-dependent enzyme [Planctomycetaceae bacterium]
MPDTAPPRRYLDNAATTWPKPPQVLDAWLHAARDVGATAGRAAYREAVEADAIRGRARAAVARLLGGVDPVRVALPGGCTLALNMAIHSLLRQGGHAIATAADHNATLRPLHGLARRGVIELTIVPCDGQGRVELEAIAAAWRTDTRLVAVSQVSNVTGIAQPVAEIAAVAHERGGLVVVDAAQALGLVDCRVAELGADVVAAAGHKWLLGTGGAGLLWVRPGLDLEPLVQGGTGSASDSLDMPEAFTERMEAGTPDVPGLAAMAAGIAWLEEQGIAAVGTRCRGLAASCAMRLAAIRGARVIGVPDGGPIVSFTVEGYDPADVAVLVEQIAGVQVRSGHHCAARIHEHLGTAAGGTVRASFGPFNTEDDVSALVGAIETITGGA